MASPRVNNIQPISNEAHFSDASGLCKTENSKTADLIAASTNKAMSGFGGHLQLKVEVDERREATLIGSGVSRSSEYKGYQ
jgi:hypothetical protein